MLYRSNITKLAAISWFSLFALINAVGVGSLKAQVNTAAISGTVLKDTASPKVSEAFHAQFRAEFFNLFNHTNLRESKSVGVCLERTEYLRCESGLRADYPNKYNDTSDSVRAETHLLSLRRPSSIFE
jgi:hypothetical protein